MEKKITQGMLFEELYKNYQRMVSLADMKYESAMKAEKDKSLELNINSRTKKENTDLKEYNQQVAALGSIIGRICQLQRSDLATISPDEDEELV